MTRVSLIVLLAAAASAAEEPKPATPAEKLAAIKKEYADAKAAFRKEKSALPDTEEGRKRFDELHRGYEAAQKERVAAAFDIAKADPKSDTGFAALEWVLTIPSLDDGGTIGREAIGLVTEYHAANPKVGKLVALAGDLFDDSWERDSPKEYAAAQKLIAAVAEKNPDKTARGQAHLGMASVKRAKLTAAELKRAPETEKLAAEAEAAYEKLAKEYGDCPWLIDGDAGTLGELAAGELREIRNLRTGKVAPDIEAEGVDGKKFKLSDHRGKVTVLVFWASWCGPCMEMVPHERVLASRLKDKPFTIVGVNGDEVREKAKEVMAKQKMTWPSFWNGDKGPDGPITKAWNVNRWPAVYVLDAKGVIRFKGPKGKELDRAVDELLKEAEPAKK